MTLRTAALAAAVFSLIFVSGNAVADGRTASDVVHGFQESLVTVMKNAKELGVAGRFDALKPIVEGTFNMPVMVATATSPFWRAASAEQRGRLITAFRRMSVSSVATLFDSYNGETFRVVRERDVDGPMVIVDTEIVRRNKNPIEISYVTVNLKERWWVIDVIVGGGISEITVRRSEYLARLKEGGPERLVAALEAQADRILAGNEQVAPAGGRS